MRTRSRSYRKLMLSGLVIVASLWSGVAATQDLSGLIVEEVFADSAAAKAGVKVGDHVLRYDDKPLASAAALQAAQQNTFGKKEITLSVQRGMQTLQLTVSSGPMGLQVRPELTPAARTVYEEARNALKAKETKAAISKLEAAAKIARMDGVKAGGGWLYWRLGGLYEGQSQWKEASAAYAVSWGLAKESDDAAAQSQTLSALGRCSQNLSDYDTARKWFEHAREVDSAAQNEAWIASDLNSLGNLAWLRDDLQAAQDYHSRALGIRERLAPDSLTVGWSLGNLGNIARRRGDLESAQNYYTRALMIFQQIDSGSMDFGRSLSNLGTVSYVRGDLQEAMDYYSRGLEIFNRLAPDSSLVASGLYDMGLVAYNRADPRATENYCSRALSLQERVVPDSIGVARSLTCLGLAASLRGDHVSAENYHNRALKLEERIAPDSLDVADNLSDLGDGALAKGDLETARNQFSRALTIREGLAPDSLPVAASLAGLGEVSFRRHLFSEARSLFSRAVAIIETQRGRVPSPEARALLIAQHAEPYQGLLRTDIALNDLPAALLTSERARARSLLDLLSEARADIREGVDPTLLERERSLGQSLNTKAEHQTRVLSGKPAKGAVEAAAREIDEATAEYDRVQAQIRSTSPRYAALTQPHPLSLEEIQEQVLDPDTLLLEYSLGDEASYLLAVSQTSIACYSLPRRADVEAATARLRQLLTAAKPQPGDSAVKQQQRIKEARVNYWPEAAALSQMLLGPVAAQLGAKRLVIVSSGALEYLPFAVLPIPQADLAKRAAESEVLIPLVVEHEIVHLPSASALGVLRQELAGRRPAARAVAVLADPVFSADDARVTPAGRDNKSHPGNERPAALLRALDDVRGELNRLPMTRDEAEAIVSATERAPGLTALDFRASLATATGAELSHYRVIHFATHGLLDTEHPSLSGLVLSLVNERGQPQDGFLRLHEIYNLRLPADLVVLSACQTGLGKEIKGEGLVGLTRGFMYAGAARVVASLWQVNDAATTELMKRFYRGMFRDGLRPSAALRAAQIDMWKRSQWQSPYYWGGFVLEGEWR